MRKDIKDMTVEELVNHRALVEAYLLQAVKLAREGGMTWRELGVQLGVSGSEANRKYSWIEKANRALPPADTGQ